MPCSIILYAMYVAVIFLEFYKQFKRMLPTRFEHPFCTITSLYMLYVVNCLGNLINYMGLTVMITIITLNTLYNYMGSTYCIQDVHDQYDAEFSNFKKVQRLSEPEPNIFFVCLN